MTSGNMIWAVAQLRPNMIRKVEANLKRQDFEYFSPKRQVVVRVGTIFKKVYKILFPGYIFVRINPFSKDVSSVDSTYGISKLLRVDKKKIGILPDSFINQLKSNKNAFFEGKKIKKGDKVKLIEGPFTNYVGSIEQIDEKGRLKILFEMLNSKIIIKNGFAKTELI
jgi:transcriptional antiterminator RfaH